MKHIANQSATLSNKLDKLSSIGKMNSVRISKIEATLRGTSPADPAPSDNCKDKDKDKDKDDKSKDDKNNDGAPNADKAKDGNTDKDDGGDPALSQNDDDHDPGFASLMRGSLSAPSWHSA